MDDAAAIENVIADLGGLVHGVGPFGRNRNRMEIGGARGGVMQRHFAGEDLRRQDFGIAPGAALLGTGQIAIAGEGELAAQMEWP